MSLLDKVRAVRAKLSPKAAKKEQWRRRELEASQREFAELKAQCGPNEMVCGTVRADGRPVYFLALRDEEDEHLENRAFRARNGRDRLPGEIVLAKMAASHTSR